MAALSPEAFIREYLLDGLGTRYLVIGDDFRFGKNRAGDFGTLQAAGREHGFEVAETPTCEVDGMRVSSTAVRAALAAGDLDLATAPPGAALWDDGAGGGGPAAGPDAGLSDG
jgi:riboflavin kinase / FMN adenylyltransferase